MNRQQRPWGKGQSTPTTSAPFQRRDPVPFELRSRIGALLDEGQTPESIAITLSISEITVHQAIAAKEHAVARTPEEHKAATAKFVAAITECESKARRHAAAVKIAGKRKSARNCTVVGALSGPCSQCREPVSDNMHVQEVRDQPSKLLCANCCPEHRASTN